MDISGNTKLHSCMQPHSPLVNRWTQLVLTQQKKDRYLQGLLCGCVGMEDDADSKSVGEIPCGFKSHHPHYE